MSLPAADQQWLWPAAVQHASWCQRRGAMGRAITCPAFGDPVTARVKDPPKAGFAA